MQAIEEYNMLMGHNKKTKTVESIESDTMLLTKMKASDVPQDIIDDVMPTGGKTGPRASSAYKYVVAYSSGDIEYGYHYVMRMSRIDSSVRRSSADVHFHGETVPCPRVAALQVAVLIARAQAGLWKPHPRMGCKCGVYTQNFTRCRCHLDVNGKCAYHGREGELNAETE